MPVGRGAPCSPSVRPGPFFWAKHAVCGKSCKIYPQLINMNLDNGNGTMPDVARIGLIEHPSQGRRGRDFR